MKQKTVSKKGDDLVIKYSGSIDGINDQEIWDARVDASLKGNMINIHFNYGGSDNLKLSKVKDGYYDGDIIYDIDRPCGKVYLWKYDRKDEFMLKGQYIEGGRTFKCFIELRPIKEERNKR